MFDFQKEYVQALSKDSRQFVNLPLGIGVVDILKEVARIKGRRLCVIAPRMLLSSRKWEEGVPLFSPEDIRRNLPLFSTDDMVYIDIGVSGRKTFCAVASCLTKGVDFIWRLS